MQIGGDYSWFRYLQKYLLFLTLLMFMEQKYSFLCIFVLQFFAINRSKWLFSTYTCFCFVVIAHAHDWSLLYYHFVSDWILKEIEIIPIFSLEVHVRTPRPNKAFLLEIPNIYFYDIC